MTANDVAEYTGLSIQAVYKWIRGTALPSYETARDLVELFNLEKIEDLIIFASNDDHSPQTPS